MKHIEKIVIIMAVIALLLVADYVSGQPVTGSFVALVIRILENDSTNENNAVPFIADGDTDGGTVRLEMDSDFTYNPSTGTATAGEFKGGGSNLTDIRGTDGAFGTGWDGDTHAPEKDDVYDVMREQRFSVKDHGATGDGTTDDTAAIQAAIDAGGEGSTIYFPRPSVNYKIVGTLDADNNYQSFVGENQVDTLINGNTSNDPVIEVTGSDCRIENLRVASGVVGIKIGTVGTKANSPILYNVTTKNCTQAGILVVNSNNGRVLACGSSADEIGLHVTDDTSDTNGWFVWGYRAISGGGAGKAKDTGVLIEGDDGDYVVTTEDFTNYGVYIGSSAIKNIVRVYDDNSGVSAHNAGSRNNHIYVGGSATIGGTFSGYQWGTAPTMYMLDEMVVKTSTETASGASETSEPLGFRHFATINNTNANLTLNLESLDAKDNEGEPFYLYFPATNTYRTEIVLNDPGTYSFVSTNQTDSTKYRVFPTGADQLIEIIYVGDSEFSVREITEELPLYTTTLALTENTDLPVDTSYKDGSVLTLGNATGGSLDFTLSDWNDARVGYALYIYKAATTSDVVLKVGNATYTDGTTDITLAAAGIYSYKLEKLVDGATSIVGIKSLDGVLANVGIATTDPNHPLDVDGTAQAEKYLHRSVTVTDAGPTDNLDVDDADCVLINTNGNNVTLGGFTNGDAGQLLYVAIIDASNNAVLEHAEGTGNQDIYLSDGADETITAGYGGWLLQCNGTHWYEVTAGGGGNVEDDQYAAGWNADATNAPSQNAVYDILHQYDTDDDGDIDNVDGAVGGGTMSSFFAEDGDGTEVEIDDEDEWKFVEGAGIDIDWTDTDNGTDADPFDLTIKVADDGIDSQHYAATSIDNEHLADDAADSDEIASGAIDLDHMSAESVDSDQYIDDSIDNAHINWADIDNLGDEGAFLLDDLGDPDAATSISFDDDETMEFDGAWNGDIAMLLSINTADLTSDTTGLKITAVDNDDSNYIPFVITDDQDGDDDELFKVTYAGTVYVRGGIIAFGAGGSESISNSVGNGVMVSGGDAWLCRDTGLGVMSPDDARVDVFSDGTVEFSVSDEDITLADGGANLINVATTTGVTTVDFGTINLATDALDLSEGNITNAGDIAIDSITADGGTSITINDDVHIGADDAIEHLTIHDAGTIIMYDDSDDTSVTLGPVGDGGTVLGVTGTINATALQVGGSAVYYAGGTDVADADVADDITCTSYLDLATYDSGSDGGVDDVDAEVVALDELSDVTIGSADDCDILVYQATPATAWIDVAMSGDATISNTGVVTVDWTNLTEGELSTGVVVSDDIKDDTIESDDYAAGSIDDEHIADDTIQEPALNVTNAGAEGIDNYVLSYNHAGTNFTWVEMTGGANYVTNDADDTMAGDLTLDDDDVGTALTVRADAANTGASIGLLITTDDDDNANFDPFEIRDDSGSGNDLLFFIDHTGAVTTGEWKGTAIADTYVPDDITIDLASTATVATTVTITDNEDTAENNPLVFVAGGDLDGGDLGLETDGTTYYTPSTGVITATGFEGALTGAVTGNADTCTTASAGDAAVDFFGAGVDAVTDATTCTDIEGTKLSITDGTLNCTETDSVVGAVSGIVKADGGGNISAAVANTDYEPALTDEASLYTTLSDVTQFYEAGDEDSIAAAIAEGELADSIVITDDIKDGTVAAADLNATLDLSSKTITLPVRPKTQEHHLMGTLWNPNVMYDNDTQICLWPSTPAALTITSIKVTCDADPDTELELDLKWADAFIGLANAAIIDQIDTTSGTTSITEGFEDADIESGKCIYLEFQADPDAGITQASIDITFDWD